VHVEKLGYCTRNRRQIKRCQRNATQFKRSLVADKKSPHPEKSKVLNCKSNCLQKRYATNSNPTQTQTTNQPLLPRPLVVVETRRFYSNF
jgi:hypothetical protein